MESTLPAAPPAAETPPETALEDQLRVIRRSLRVRIALLLGLAVLFILCAGPAILLGPREALLIGLPLALVVEFALGFSLSGKMMALSIAQHHDRLRAELVSQQGRATKALVDRWQSLDATERSALRVRFPDMDWDAIDRLAGTDTDRATKH